LVRSGDDKIDVGVLVSRARERGDEQVDALLLVNAAEEKDETPTPYARRMGEKGSALRLGVAGNVTRPVADDEFARVVGAERLASEPPLFFAGEEHAGRVAQNAVFEQPPEDALEEGLGRIGAIEPRVEHAVGEDKVGRRAATQRAPGAERGVVPQPINDNSVVLGRILPKPSHQAWRVTISKPGNLRARQTVKRAVGSDSAGRRTRRGYPGRARRVK
jgi:hypothetical protein